MIPKFKTKYEIANEWWMALTDEQCVEEFEKTPFATDPPMTTPPKEKIKNMVMKFHRQMIYARHMADLQGITFEEAMKTAFGS